MNNQELGSVGEAAAVRYLEEQGYQIIDRNWRCPEGEVDIVARDTLGTLAFVEVKTRTSNRCGTPAEAITAQKLARMRKVAAQWLRQCSVRAGKVRLDLIAISAQNQADLKIDHRKALQ